MAMKQLFVVKQINIDQHGTRAVLSARESDGAYVITLTPETLPSFPVGALFWISLEPAFGAEYQPAPARQGMTGPPIN
jgi:hypothetical protein